MSCPQECERFGLSCSRKGQCCDKNCLSGCAVDSNQTCFTCRKFFFQNKCVHKCPENTYEVLNIVLYYLKIIDRIYLKLFFKIVFLIQYLGRRCITKDECLDISTKYYNKENKYLKTINGICTLDCPPGYSESSQDHHSCESCQGPCPKSELKQYF